MISSSKAELDLIFVVIEYIVTWVQTRELPLTLILGALTSQLAHRMEGMFVEGFAYTCNVI
jgi:hypothetical protein